jgi:DNA-binding response OmpR family regulator
VKPRIIVFDPSPNVLTLFRAVLSRSGYAVYPYNQEFIGMREIEQIKPHLIILGYFRGYSQAEFEELLRVRSQSMTRNIPIIICTTGPIDLPDDRVIPNVSIFPKPFDTADLLLEIHKALRATAHV